ncbi:2-dehydropantoate 2-reductase [Paenibacillus anaericanus]|uniref:ketopantoate reductase family protein n=1 Tax=Paenibacillus anaericanus TaxID=170367 RepID=UPI00277E51B5|nr:2-dehydropantoate 2-reductase N-terminal domain-containing protein [Paenibacillus anaericanus]MDQ0089049.1 2-dehydropantoate 2-reductase [Paenibacillus anaericanus]
MRILIYGAGVIGSIFAGKLSANGNDVTVLARNNRFQELKNNGLNIKHIHTNKVENYPIKVIDHLIPDDVYDYIVVPMKFEQIDDILPILSQNISPNIVLCVNNPSGYDKWKSFLGSRLMVGFPACGGKLIDNITEYYISKGVTRGFQTTTFGEIDGITTNRLTILLKLFSHSGIPSISSKYMDNWQKCHIAIVTPIANAIYKNNGDIKALANKPLDIDLMINATRQGLEALQELGYKVEPQKLNFYYLPKFILRFAFGFGLKSTIADFSMAMHANNAKLEMTQLKDEFKNLIKDTTTNKEAIYRLNEFCNE